MVIGVRKIALRDDSPGNKLISGLRDSAVSWAIILPLYWYCEKGAAAA